MMEFELKSNWHDHAGVIKFKERVCHSFEFHNTQKINLVVQLECPIYTTTTIIIIIIIIRRSICICQTKIRSICK
jgi:hypothetical protein